MITNNPFENIGWKNFTTREEVDEVIERFTGRWPDSRWGPAHIVLEDYNLYDDNINWCLGLIDAVLFHRHGGEHAVGSDDLVLLEKLNWYSEHAYDELTATRMLLNNLLHIPESVRALDDEDGD